MLEGVIFISALLHWELYSNNDDVAETDNLSEYDKLRIPSVGGGGICSGVFFVCLFYLVCFAFTYYRL